MQTYPQAHALYVVSIRQTRVLPPTSFRLSYYSDNLNYPSNTIIQAMFRYDWQQDLLIKTTRI